MKIINSNYNNTSFTMPQFKSRFLESLRQSANLKKPLESMTKGDCHCLSSYLYSLKFRMGITQDEIKNLLSKNGVEFLQRSADYFKQKMGFSDNNFPPIVLMEGTFGGAKSAYALEQNVVYLTNTFEDLPKPQLFGLLRHEFQHAIQNHIVLRTEGLGEEAVAFYAEKAFDKQKSILLEFAKNYSIKELLAQSLINEYGVQLVSELRCAMQRDDINAIDEILKQFKQGIVAGLNEFRKNLIKEQGLIKADSKIAKFAKEYFKDFKNIDYFDENGKLDIGKHSFKASETEAELSQLMAESEISQTCFIRLQKNNLEKVCKDKETAASIDKEFEKYSKD